MGAEQIKEALQGARQSQKREYVDGTISAVDVKLGSVTSRIECSEDEVCKWKEDIKDRRGEGGRLLLNALQYEMSERVADQVCVELRARATNHYENVQPLRWSMHGGPGTGQSHVIKMIKKEWFEYVLRYKVAEDFQIVSLQAVMAELLEDDTIHYALNLPVFGKTASTHSQASRKHEEVAKQLLQWRWLIIDEISMVGARLLADVDCKLRALAGASSPFKKINVVCNVHSEA